MRGAVLHKLGLNLIKERIMRRNYGICRQRPFHQGKDPERLRFVDSAGEVVCKEVMFWYAQKVAFYKSSALILRAKKCQMGRL